MKTLELLVVAVISGLTYTSVVSETFSYFSFVQQWPPTVCVSGVQEKPPRKCKLPASLNYWTIHGLWPISLKDCNKTPFNMSVLQPLRQKLEKWWKNLYVSKFDELWEHEWITHGTCAMSLKATRNQKLYFSKTLDIRQGIDILGLLQSCKIVPSDNVTYKVPLSDAKANRAAILKCLKNKLKVEPRIRCIKNEKSNQQDLFELYIYLNKSFKMINCPNETMAYKEHAHSKDCPNEGIYYRIIHH